MRHEVSWDEKHVCVRVTLRGLYSPEDAAVVLSRVHAALEGRPRRLMLADYGADDLVIPPATRRYMLVNTAHLEIERAAFIGMSPVARVSARIGASMLGHKDDVGFFETEAHALAWLHG